MINKLTKRGELGKTLYFTRDIYSTLGIFFSPVSILVLTKIFFE